MLTQFSDFAIVVSTDSKRVLTLKGEWAIHSIAALELFIKALSKEKIAFDTVDASAISEMDTAGAFFLHAVEAQCKAKDPNFKVVGLSPKFYALLALVSKEIHEIAAAKISKKTYPWLYRLGQRVVAVFDYSLIYFTFLGELFIRFIRSILHPFKIQWRSIVNELDLTGFRALIIIAVMMFLIGIVLAYQLGVELRIYGANVYVVDVTGIAIFREFSPLITSVIIAGRTSTSYAALIGTMKVNEEIDALKTMGLSPIDRLVLPRIIGLLISLPLLVVWGNLFGLLGSMVMGKNMLGIGYVSFLERLKEVVAVKHLYLGLVKTPVFSLIIAGIGCFQGFQAEGSAQSVGIRTTKAAVQAIFLIILADAMFSILFNWMDL